MSRAAPGPDRPGGPGGPGAPGAPGDSPAVSGRADMAEVCARYAELVLLQLEALAAEDLAAFEECAAARDAIAGEIGAAGAAVQADLADPAVAAVAAEQLARAERADRLILERLIALRAQAAAALSEHDTRRPRVLAYGSAAPREHGALDISL